MDLTRRHGYSKELGEKLYYNFTWGHKGATKRILRGKSFKEADIIPALEDTVAIMVANIKRLGLNEEQERILYEVLVGMSVSRVVNFLLMDEFYRDMGIDINMYSSIDFMNLTRHLLKESTLVTRTNEWGSGIIDQPVRYVMASWLRLTNRPLFEKLHGAASDIAEQVAERSPMIFSSQVVAYLYHKAWERKASYNDVAAPLPSETLEEMRKKFKEMVELSLDKIRSRWWEAVGLLNELEARLDQDPELKMLLGRPFIEELDEQIESIREQVFDPSHIFGHSHNGSHRVKAGLKQLIRKLFG